MTETAAVSDEVLNDRKPSVKHKWRGKLFSSEGKLKKNAEIEKLDDVSDFLRPAAARTSQDLPAPRIDTSAAHRWPSAAEVIQATTSTPNPRSRKTPRRTGLRVNFSNSQPVIIGEGGDEAELPTIALSKSREAPRADWLPQAGNLPEEAAASYQPLDREKRANPDSNGILKPPLQRIQTGLNNQSSESSFDVNERDCPQDDPDSSLTPSTSNRLSHAQSESLRDRLRFLKTEKQVRSEEYSQVAANSTTTYPERSSSISTEKASTSDSASQLKLPAFDQSLSLENSLTPAPSPRPPFFSSKISNENVLTPTAPIPSPKPPPLSKNLSYSNRLMQPIPADYAQSSQGTELSVAPSKSEETPKPVSDIRPFSIRDVAKNLGDDALEDFSSRVQRFSDIFQIGASIISPVMDISFAQWIRTSAYWFLKGRGELENAVRTEARDSQGMNPDKDSNVSFGLRQAYLDLAKAWWILGKITCNHPELKWFGNASLSSLVAIVKSFGDLKLAELIEVHLAITANMRALTMSMKRNNRLPPISFEIQGLETRMFVEAPSFPPHVAGVLSERSQMFTAGDPRSTEAFFPIPVGDTKRHFIYSSVIVDLLYFSQGEKCEEIRLPCVLSVLRERSDRDLKAVIASQSGKINLLIHSDRKAGLIWKDVSWKAKTNSIRIKLSDSVDIYVQFLEKDFKSLWGIHDYTRKVQEGLRGRDGEQEVFQDTLKIFQNVDQQSAKIFPPEPIKGCYLRLFERKRTLSSSTRERKTHAGHRLMVVTPPSIKALSSINLDLDKKFPIMFSYLRGEEAAPALLLKISKPSLESYMVMTFREVTNRGMFHSLIDGTSVSLNEVCSQPLPLDSFTISETSVEGLPSFPGQNFVNAIRWQQVRVIQRGPSSPAYNPHGALPEDLRIWVESETGSFVDRLNFGSIPSANLKENLFTQIGPGEMQLSLPVEIVPEIRLLRHKQADATFSFANNKLSKEDAEALCRKLQSLDSTTTIHYFRFSSLTGTVQPRSLRYTASLT